MGLSKWELRIKLGTNQKNNLMKKNSPQNKYRRKKNLVFKKEDVETLVLSNDKSQIHKLNETSAFIWDLLEEPQPLSFLISEIKKTYDVKDFGSVEDDVLTLLDQLYKLKIIEIIS